MAGQIRTFFQTSEMARLIGMPEKRLTKFVESPGYGITPSVRSKAGKGAPRLFSPSDLFKIALVWWLFQTGLRSQVIGRVVKSKEGRKFLADAEKGTKEVGNSWLVINREIAPYEPPPQEVVLSILEEISPVLHVSNRNGFEIIPVGGLLGDLWNRLRASETSGS